jgi:NAD+ kinase
MVSIRNSVPQLMSYKQTAPDLLHVGQSKGGAHNLAHQVARDHWPRTGTSGTPMPLTTTLLSDSDTEDTFSTPSTPTLSQMSPSLSRKNSPPLNLHLSPFAMTDVVVDDQPSPDVIQTRIMQEIPENGSSVTNEPMIPTQRPTRMHPTKSPCFVHSHLDKGAFLSDWLRSNPWPSHHHSFLNSNPSKPADLHLARDDVDEYPGSLTTQLAETAVGVREMSKQLGMH